MIGIRVSSTHILKTISQAHVQALIHKSEDESQILAHHLDLYSYKEIQLKIVNIKNISYMNMCQWYQRVGKIIEQSTVFKYLGNGI